MNKLLCVFALIALFSSSFAQNPDVNVSTPDANVSSTDANITSPTVNVTTAPNASNASASAPAPAPATAAANASTGERKWANKTFANAAIADLAAGKPKKHLNVTNDHKAVEDLDGISQLIVAHNHEGLLFSFDDNNEWPAQYQNIDLANMTADDWLLQWVDAGEVYHLFNNNGEVLILGPNDLQENASGNKSVWADFPGGNIVSEIDMAIDNLFNNQANNVSDAAVDEAIFNVLIADLEAANKTNAVPPVVNSTTVTPVTPVAANTTTSQTNVTQTNTTQPAPTAAPSPTNATTSATTTTSATNTTTPAAPATPDTPATPATPVPAATPAPSQ